MKKIISNKVYDTETAKKVGAWDNGILPSDFDALEETLYRKRTGEFFIHGEGGAATQYAKWRDNSSMSGERIIPMTVDDAMEWADKKLDADAYGAAFGIPVEGTATIYATVSAAAKSKLDAACSKTGKTQAEILENLLMLL